MVIEMAFSHMLNILKEKEKGTIVLVRLGSFYVAVGEDAVLLHKKLDLKCTCFKMNICKVGFPVIALDKYVEKLNETKYSYVIYDYDAKNVELMEITRKRGTYNFQTDKNINCIECSGDVNKNVDNYFIGKVWEYVMKQEETLILIPINYLRFK